MRKIACYMIGLFCACLLTSAVVAQNITISGDIVNSVTNEKVAAVTVIVKGASEGTFTDDKGTFKISTAKLPATLIISAVGYTSQEIEVSSTSQPLTVQLVPSLILGQEVVVSATRVATRILESPVSIERVNAAAIRNAPAATY